MTPKTRVAVYLAVAFGMSWSLWAVAYLLFKVFHVLDLMGFLASTSVPMIGPAAGFLVVKLLDRPRPLAGPPRPVAGFPRNRLFSVLALKNTAVACGATAFALLISSVVLAGILRARLGLENVWENWRAFGLVWLATVPVWIPMVILEEIGWRHFLFNAWRTRHPVWPAIVVGLLWSIWHLPTFFFYGHFFINLTLYLLFVPALHFVGAWAYVRGRSLAAPVLVHAVYNAFATAIGFSGFLYAERMPYEATAASQAVKLASNAFFAAALIPFLVLLVRELKRSADSAPAAA